MGQRLKRLREAQGLSQYAVADKAGISRQYVRKLKAELSGPTLGMLQRLAKALGVPVVRLLE